MILTDIQLKNMIMPMARTALEMNDAEGLVDGLVELIRQDREAHTITEDTSDGYHTFKELYLYRMLYSAAFFNSMKTATGSPESGQPYWFDVHKSWRHNDGELCFGGGWFIVMATLPTGQVSNHYESQWWDLFDIPEYPVANKYDGHTPQEAADRLLKYLKKEGL
jgi:hypothetical protein